MASTTEKTTPIDAGDDATLLDAMVQRSSIRRTLMIIMGLALLPLLILSAWQGVARFERERDITHIRLDDRADIIAASQLNPLRSAAGLLTLLAADRDVSDASLPDCQIRLENASAAFPHVLGLMVAAPDGTIICSGGSIDPATASLIGPASPLPVAREPRLRMTLPATGSATGDSEMLMALRRDDGTRIAARLGTAWLEGLAGTLDGNSRYAVTLTDGTGRVLASSRPGAWTAIDPTAPGQQPRTADASGRLWLHGSATLVPGSVPEESIQLILSQPEAEPFDATWLFNVSFALLPLIALMLAWLAIWIGADRSILRWVRDIGALADDIGRGQPLPGDDRFVHAPQEIRSLAAQLKRVARIIADRDQNLRRAAEQERLSALELHHRVRNNLQIIGSWLAMEHSKLPEGAASEAMDRVAMRVAAISLVHRLLYDGPDQCFSDPAALIGPLCQLLERQGIGNPLACETATIQEPVGIDTAVQLSLWLVEAGIAALPAAADGPLAVRLSAHADSIQLELALDGGTGHRHAETPVPPVLKAIARQMNGKTTARLREQEGDLPLGYRLVIPRRCLAGMNNFSAI